MATDYRGQMYNPEKYVFQYVTAMSIFFILFMIVGSFFILNLCVGVIVDNFSRMKDESGGHSILLTETQKQYQDAKRMVDRQNVLFGVRDLHLLPPRRRRMYFFVRDPSFESFIMLCILLNTLVMALKSFPQ